MSITIGSARHDENGKYVNGAAGDQLQTSSTNDTAGEVSMQAMYTHSKGWYIIRAKSVDIANKIAELMKKACNNANIGYDQNGRLGIITYGISTTTKTECDCSSLVREIVKEATGKDPGNFTTENEASMLAATGYFEDKVAYTSQSATPVYNGDILVTKTKGHTVVVVSGNARSSTSSSSSSSSSVSQNTSSLNQTEQWVGLVTASSLNVRTWAGTSYGKCSFSPLKKGTEVSVCDSVKASDGSTWYYILYNKKYGFVHSSYISKKSTTSSSSSSSSSATSSKKATDAAKSKSSSLSGTYTTTANVNVRNGAGTSKSIMVTIPKGTEVKNYGYYTTSGSTKWLYVQFTYNKVTYTGFICSTYLKKK